MIDDLSTYSVSDFILFSKETLLGLFSTYNRDIWPWQILIFILNLSLFWVISLRRPWSGRLISFYLSLIWFWIGFVFQKKYYFQINWTASYFAWLFFAEAALLFLVGTVMNRLEFQMKRKWPQWIGFALFAFSGFIYLLVHLFLKHDFSEALLFGWGVDLTAIGTMGLLLMNSNRFLWIPVFFPALVWSVIASLTFYGLNSTEWIWYSILISLAIAGAIAKLAFQVPWRQK